MITKNHIVYDIKNIAYGGTISDDSKVSDRQVGYWVSQIRSLLIHQQLVSSRKINESFVQHIECVEMENVDVAECCDETTGCYVLRSKKVLPKTIHRGGRNSILSVTSVDKKTSFSETTYFRAKTNKYNTYTAKKSRWYIKNDYLYIINNNLIDKVSVSGIFEFPEEAGEFKTCSGDACFDPDTSPYPITSEMSAQITDIVLQTRMGLARSAPNDEDNDAKGEEKGQVAQQAR